MRSHELGKEGEHFAREFLIRQGYRILEVNFRRKTGEIDIIADDHGVIVFVEIKTRQEKGGWDAFEAVDVRKQRRMMRTATLYLVAAFGREDVSCRFDVLAVRRSEKGGLSAELIREAFSGF